MVGFANARKIIAFGERLVKRKNAFFGAFLICVKIMAKRAVSFGGFMV